MKEDLIINCNNEQVNLNIFYCHSDKIVDDVILFIHGFGGDRKSEIIKDIVFSLLQKNVAVVTFDLPCHGDNNYGISSFSVKNALNYIHTIETYLTTKFGIKNVHFFSTSYGAYLTLLHFKSTNNNNSKAIFRAPAILMPSIFESKILNYLGKTLSIFKEEGSTVLGFSKQMQVPYSYYEELMENNIASHAFKNKIYICQGDQDPVVELASVKDFAKNNSSNTTLEIFEGSNHSIKHFHEVPRIIEIVKEHFSL